MRTVSLTFKTSFELDEKQDDQIATKSMSVTGADG